MAPVKESSGVVEAMPLLGMVMFSHCHGVKVRRGKVNSSRFGVVEEGAMSGHGVGGDIMGWHGGAWWLWT